MSKRIREVHHVGLDGVPAAGRPEVLSESTEQVVCSWCATDDLVEPISAADEAR